MPGPGAGTVTPGRKICQPFSGAARAARLAVTWLMGLLRFSERLDRAKEGNGADPDPVKVGDIAANLYGGL